MMQADADRKIQIYLDRFRRRLRRVSRADVQDSINELRSHIIDAIGPRDGMTPTATVDEALEALGSPEELADQYVGEDLPLPLSRPVRALEALSRWASVAVGASLTLLGSIAGYSLGLVFVLCAVVKPIHPRTAGLWVFQGPTGDTAISLHLGFGQAPFGGREVMGWWVVPAGLLVGCLLLMATTHFALVSSRRCRESCLLKRG